MITHLVVGQDGKFTEERVTPKNKAALIIASQIGALLEFSDEMMDHEPNMTEREREQVVEQIEKYSERIFKMLGF